MAQNIVLQGATYSAVPSVNLPKQGGGTASFVDVTDTTAAAADVASGKYFYTSAGVRTAGTNSGGGGGMTVATATATPVSASSSISFTGLGGEPTSFYVVSAADLATGASPYKTAAVVYDGTDVIGQTITNTNNAQVSYDNTNFSYTYNSGTLTITGSTYFQANQYKLVYTYGGSSANIGTDDVQVGSGATSITFTGLSEEPSCFSCIFKSNFATSTGYTRTIVVVYDGTNTYGMEMGSGALATSNWSYTYNSGSLTISSQSTSAGGYFHQPGYYQLTYGIGGTVELDIQPLNVTANGTYQQSGVAYSPVTVNVSGGGSSKNAQTAQSTSRSTSTTYTEVISLTCTKAGTYNVYWSTFRSSTSGTWGSQLYLNDTAYGSAQTGDWSNHIQNIHLSNVTIAANADVSVRVRSRGSNYYGYVGTLTIIEA